MLSRNLQEQFAMLPETLGNHLTLCIVSLLLGMVISLPLAVIAVRRRRLQALLLGIASVIQTVPGLALLALMVPLLAALGLLTSRLAGVEISALGFTPTVIALTLYSMLPMMRNTVTGISGVDPDLTEAARALGMTPSQVLWKVELPLATPVILAGIRTATVWVVGTATLSTPVGQVSLGNHIFMGLQTRNWTAVLFGCVAAAGLALALDLLVGGLERAARHRSKPLATACAAGLVLLIGGGLLAPRLAASAGRLSATGSLPAPSAQEATARPVRIGTKTFTEQYVLGHLLEAVLSANGFSTQRMDSLGSTIVFDALRSGEIDVYVDYSGTIWANHMQRSGGGSRREIVDEVTRWLASESGLICLGSLGFENAYALAMRRDLAERLGLRTIADLAPHAASLSIGGDYEFFGRPEWRQIQVAYGLSFARQVSFDSTFMYGAAARGEADVISAFSSDGRIEAFDLVVLQDPLQVIPPYDAILLVSSRAAARPGLVPALRPLVGTIEVRDMRRANYMVDRDVDKRTVSEAAQWLGRRAGVLPEN